MNVDALVPVPAGVVTLILPVTAPMGTVAVIFVDELTEKVVADTPPNFTEVAPVKPVPVMVTTVPALPAVGVNDVIVGFAPVTTKSLALVAVPAGVVTLILPVVAPEGTLVVIFVPAEFTSKLAETPLNFTDVAPVKFDPLMVTDVPTGPLVGEKELIVGVAEVVTVKSVALVAVPPGVVTMILPEVAPEGTLVVILVPAEFTLKFAETPLNFTDVAPVKFDPLMVTDVPTGPLLGEKEVIVGADAAVVTVKFVALVAVPSGVDTLIFPVMAPVGTVAVTLVDETVLNAAAVFLNLTPVTSTKLVPLIVTRVPTGPDDGENDVIVGASAAHAGTASSPIRTPRMARNPRA